MLINLFKGNSEDKNTYQWHLGNYTTEPKVGPEGSDGYLVAIRGNTSSVPGKAELYSPHINGVDSG